MKKQNILILLGSFLVILFSSCAKMPVYKSKSVDLTTEVDLSKRATGYSNAKKNIDIGVMNSDSYLYLQACFHNQNDLKKIMNGGLHIYFDPNGKKNKDYELSIEREEMKMPVMNRENTSAQGEKNAFNSMDREKTFSQNSMPNQNSRMNVSQMICKDFNKITWSKQGNDSVFYRNLSEGDIAVWMSADVPGQLFLALKMPLSEISVEPGKSFTVGVETETAKSEDSEKSQNGPPGGMGMGMGGGPGGMGGGMPGGMSGGMPPGGRGPDMGNSSQKSSRAYNFWFNVKL